MFRLPAGTPTDKASITELTDFLECECIKSKRGRISILSLISTLLIGSDEIDFRGVDDDYDRLNFKTDEILTEVDRRKEAANDRYPFRVERNGLKVEGKDSPIYWTYCYLLFCTWFNMQTDRRMAGIDGSLLFERFSELVAREYFGARAKTFLFGTAQKERFEEKVNELCRELGEGVEFENKMNVSANQIKDDRLDVVVWKSFADRKESKLIGFGQCKTGTSWRSDNSLTQLRPENFCQKWFRRMPAHTPARLFFVADTFNLDTWYNDASDAGIVFDRFRLMDYLPDNEEFQRVVYEDLVHWTAEAISRISKL